MCYLVRLYKCVFNFDEIIRQIVKIIYDRDGLNELRRVLVHLYKCVIFVRLYKMCI